jgi:adenosine 3'-phospho 5'-phosphosulfate transporter B2
MNDHTDITMHIVLLSLTSAIGQIFIFVTIQKFGALVFSLIMTTRQVLSIVLSSMVFEHSMTLQGMLGVSLIFFALFLQQYLKFESAHNKTKHVGNEPKASSSRKSFIA